MDQSQRPPDACGEYLDYKGDVTWIKDIDLKQPHYPVAYVWSWTTKRWRARREFIRMDRARIFEPVPSLPPAQDETPFKRS